MPGIFETFRTSIDQRLKDLLMESRDEVSSNATLAKAEEELAKGVDSAVVENRQRYRYRRASLVDPSITPALGEGGYGVYRPRYSHLSNKTLKEMSLRDPIVSAIFQTRLNQIARFSRPQEDRYEPGFRFVPRDPSIEVKAGSEEELEISWLTDYVRNTGSNEDRSPESKMDFDTFLRLIARDRLTYGAAAIETIRNHVGGIHSFLPAPTESIYYANKRLPTEIINQAVASQTAVMSQSNRSVDEVRELMDQQEQRERQRDDDEEIEFVQVVNGRVHQTFTRKELLYKLGNPQNFIENNGYCIGELEMATMTITGHLQAENYNRLFFTHGFASRGLIHIAGDVGPSQLQAFRSQWYAQISGNENSWRTPIIAGVDSVEWIPLSASNRDMEYSVYVDHIIRTLCSIFAISPIEIGFDYLTKGQGTGGLGQEDNEAKIEQSQVRGLKPLLVWIETIINEDIIPNVSEDFAAKYKFQFVGLDVESKTEEVQRQTAEVQVRSAINEARREAGKDPVLGGDIVLNPTYIQTLLQTHKIGEIREFLFGYPGDSENPEFNYVSDPNYFQNLTLMIQAEQQQMQAEAEAGSAEGGEFGEEGEGQEGEAGEEGEVPEGEEGEFGAEEQPFGGEETEEAAQEAGEEAASEEEAEEQAAQEQGDEGAAPAEEGEAEEGEEEGGAEEQFRNQTLEEAAQAVEEQDPEAAATIRGMQTAPAEEGDESAVPTEGEAAEGDQGVSDEAAPPAPKARQRKVSGRTPAKYGKKITKSMALRRVINRRPQSAGLLRKAVKVGWSQKDVLAKADVVTPHHHHKVKVLDGELERARRQHLQAFKRAEGAVVSGILEAMKAGLDDGEGSPKT